MKSCCVVSVLDAFQTDIEYIASGARTFRNAKFACVA